MRYAFLFFCGLLALATAAQAKVLTMAVGQVRDHVVTSREVQINQAVEQALAAKDKLKSVRINDDIENAAFAKLVTSVLLEWIVFLEAKSVQVAALGSDEVAQAVAQCQKRMNHLAPWKKLKVTSGELAAVVERKLQAKKFIRFRADSSVIPIGDAEAERYFQQNRLKFGSQSFAQFKTEIKAHLAKQQVEKRLKDWFEVLETKYQARNYLAEL